MPTNDLEKHGNVLHMEIHPKLAIPLVLVFLAGSVALLRRFINR